MPDFSVTLVFDADRDLPELLSIEEMLESMNGWAARIGGRMTVTFDVSAPDVLAAAAAVPNLIERADLTDLPVVDLRVQDWPEVEREAERARLPELVGASEAAEILGVSRQRVHQLATTHEDFPEPLVEVRMGPLWAESAIRAWAARWDRKPGRPAKAEAV